MSGEVSYFSRFFVKFVEVIAAGVATAISAYLLAHFGGLLPPPSTPVSAPAPTAVQVGPTASEVAESRRAQPTPPVAAAAVNEQRAVPQQDTDAPVAQPALKPVTDAKALPPRKRTKTDTSVSEKEPRQKSAEALARAALANVDANRPTPADLAASPRKETPNYPPQRQTLKSRVRRQFPETETRSTKRRHFVAFRAPMR
jgi:type IV secretory pathway VirB10-like protein